MKKKFSKIFGVGLTIAMVASLVLIAAPVGAAGDSVLVKVLTDAEGLVGPGNPMSGIVECNFIYDPGSETGVPDSWKLTMTGPCPYDTAVPIGARFDVDGWAPGAMAAAIEIGIVDWDGDGVLEDGEDIIWGINDPLTGFSYLTFWLDTTKNWTMDNEDFPFPFPWDRSAYTSVWPNTYPLETGPYVITTDVLDSGGASLLQTALSQEEWLYNEPYIEPDLSTNVKGAKQIFVIKQAGPEVLGLHPCFPPGPEPQVPVTWDVKPGVQMNTVGPPGSGDDIIIQRAGYYCCGEAEVGKTEIIDLKDLSLVNAEQFVHNGLVPDATIQQDAGVSDCVIGLGAEWVEICSVKVGDVHVYAYDVKAFDWTEGVPVVADGQDGIDAVDSQDLPGGIQYCIDLHGEKKWGWIQHTELDVDLGTPGIQTDHMVPVEDCQWIQDMVFADFLWGDFPPYAVQKHGAGGAIVHWFLFEDNATTEDLIDELMDWLGECPPGTGLCGCGNYPPGAPPPPGAPWPSNWTSPLEWITSIYNNINPHTGLPIDLLDGLNPGDNRADFTWFSDVAPWAGLPYVNLVMTPLGGRDIITRTEDSWWFEIPGRTRVELCNAGEEDIIIVTYVEYPNVDYHGENPICVEKARKTYKEYEKVQVKIPQVRWAGEKIVIEKDWGAAYGPGVIGQCVTFTIDQDSIGTLVPVCGMDDGTGNHVETWVMEDGVARVIFESEYEGQAEVKCVLYDNYCMDCMGMCPLGLPIDNHDFPLFYLAIESIEVLDGTPKSVDPFEDAYFGVQVKGWFHNKATYDSSRPVGWLDLDPLTDAAANVVNGGDGIPYNDHEYKLPEGRWVMPDDWPTLAGFYEDNPQWDLMNNWEDRDFGIWSAISPSGPFNSAVVTTIFPGLAEFPVIGPFNTTQPVAIEDELIKWVTTASVIADYNVEFPWLIPPVFPPPMPNNNDWTVVDLRNTVVPDGKIEWFDCPMPPAKVIFQVADDQLPFDLFAAGKFWLEPYSDIIAGIWYAPYYSEEIPSSWFIPKGAVPEGYSWDSWGAWTQSLLDDCPYPFWLDLNLSTLPATDDEVIEVYSDNNGRAHVGMWALGEQGEVIIRARVDYPYMGKYSSVGSREVTQRWGAEELNPWFLADKTVVDVFDTVTFTNETTFGQHPYTRAEWDFNDDGVADIVIEGTEAQVMADVTWAYDAAGVYNVKLTMRDSAPTTRWEVRLDYITVSGGGILLGDANQDGVVNALDITYIEMIIAGLVPATPEADANQDGVVNALDITATEIIIAG